MPRVIKRKRGAKKKEKRERGLCVLTVFHFCGTKASSGNTVLQLALDVIVPAEKPLSFLRGCIQIYSLTAGNRSWQRHSSLAREDVLYITIGRWWFFRLIRVG